VDDPDCTISVNGVEGENYGFGVWVVDNVPLPPGGTVRLQATALLSGGGTCETLLDLERGPIVFTQTFGYKLDYNMLDWTYGETNASETHHIELQWTRALGGTNLLTRSLVDLDTGDISSNLTVTVWPADNGYLPMLPGQKVCNDYTNGGLMASYTNIVSAPTVGQLQWMEESAIAGSLPAAFGVSFSEWSGREVGLFTGGAPFRLGQGLFDLSAALSVESELDPDVVNWGVHHQGFSAFLQPADPPVAVLSEQIILGALDNLKIDGNLWALQPDGAEILITPKAPDTSYTGQLPSAQKSRLQILANDIDLRTNMPEFCVGQQVLLQANWSPALPADTETTVWWLYSLDFANIVVPGNGESSDNYLIDLLARTNNPTALWWYSGGKKIVWCYTTNVFSNGQVIAFTPAGEDISVWRPTVLLNPSNAVVVLDTNTPGNIFLGLGDPSGAGQMQWDMTVNWKTNYPGTFSYVQLINRAISYDLNLWWGGWVTKSDGTQGDLWLDNTCPYEVSGPYHTPRTTRVLHTPFADAPEIEGDLHSFAEMNDTFNTYLRFQPDSAGSIPATICRVDWAWNGRTDKTNAVWSLTKTNVTVPTLHDDNSFPSWLHTYHNTAP
jgi:hypothetical protein